MSGAIPPSVSAPLGSPLFNRRPAPIFILSQGNPAPLKRPRRKHTENMNTEHKTEVESPRLLPFPEVRERTGLSRATVWRYERAGQFPARVQLTANRVGWRSDELATWIANRRRVRVR